MSRAAAPCKAKPVPIDTWKERSGQPKLNESLPATGKENPEWNIDMLTPGSRDLQDMAPVKARILIVESDPASCEHIQSLLMDLNHEFISARSTADAVLHIAQQNVDLVIVGLNTPALGGIGLCERLRWAEATRQTPVFILSPSAQANREARAIGAGADEFLVAPLNPGAFRARVHATLRHASIMRSLGESEAILFSLAKSVEDRDPDLGQHCQRLAVMAAAMGIVLRLSASDIRALHRGGYLHDIGKMDIPEEILFKAGPLTPEEWTVMKSHAEHGERICAPTKSLASVLPIIRHHHERYDGSGYPDGLKGEQIPLLARIVQTVDIYDALITERPYKRAFSPEEAIAIMRGEVEKGWRDGHLVEVLASLLPAFRNNVISETTPLSLHALADALERHGIDVPRGALETTLGDNLA